MYEQDLWIKITDNPNLLYSASPIKISTVLVSVTF